MKLRARPLDKGMCRRFHEPSIPELWASRIAECDDSMTDSLPAPVWRVTGVGRFRHAEAFPATAGSRQANLWREDDHRPRSVSNEKRILLSDCQRTTLKPV
jgi:hypothetical protein